MVRWKKLAEQNGGAKDLKSVVAVPLKAMAGFKLLFNTMTAVSVPLR